jgi:YD repeat-containing protein
MLGQGICTGSGTQPNKLAWSADMNPALEQSPISNAQVIAAAVFSHSGEFAPQAIDLRLPGRGFDVEFKRSYRSSRSGQIGTLGRGWACGLVRKIERQGDDVLYHNGTGDTRLFSRRRDGQFDSPAGFYAVFRQEHDEFVFRLRFGLVYRFAPPESGGRMVSIEDRNHNIIRFSGSDSSFSIVDTLGRKIALALDQGLVRSLTDPAGRSWKYVYDGDQRLVEVIQPATTDFPNGTSVRYGYDDAHRLIALTDAKGQTFLVTQYDDSGRVVMQQHGSGTYTIEYEAIGAGRDGFPIYRTTCRGKTERRQVFEHNEAGNVITSTLWVRRGSFAPEDVAALAGDEIALTTTSAFNRHCELTSRRFPGGHETRWTYTEGDSDPRNQGNLSQVTQLPAAGVDTDQESLVTSLRYEQNFQLPASRTDARGNETAYEYDGRGNLLATIYPPVSIQRVDAGPARSAPRAGERPRRAYAYNSMGQILRLTGIDGSVTEYQYYPADDPCGQRGLGGATGAPDQECGYLARIIRDAVAARVTNEYAYDPFGNLAVVYDGKGNAARLHYNAMGKLESLIGRPPFAYRIDYKYDANYNEIESARSLDRFVYEEGTQKTTLVSTALSVQTERNVLGNVTARRFVGADCTVSESFVRDVGERVIRQIQPLGDVTEYRYDERDSIIEKRFGATTSEAIAERCAYALGGGVRRQTDGNGSTTTIHYDGFQRCRGITDPAGTTRSQWFDAAGNVVRVRVGGAAGVSLMEARYHVDQWNRAWRIDQAWHHPATGEALGQSNWNGESGIVSTVVEYAPNGRVGNIWSETGNVVTCEYDGAGRIAAIADLTGAGYAFEYDQNSNVTLLRRQGADADGQAVDAVLCRSYDAVDRMATQQENDNVAERFRYNVFGAVIGYQGSSGIEIHHTLDALGRATGHAFEVTHRADAAPQKIVRRFEYDDNYRLSASVDAMGNRTVYGYDAIGRQNSVVYPDGNAARVGHDAKGNVVRIVDPNNRETINRYDAADRLVERRWRAEAGDTATEQYEYDGAGRLRMATSGDFTIRRSHDSLSRLMWETQGERTTRYVHDAAGNLIRLAYPGGDEVHRSYDVRCRVVAVQDQAGAQIAGFRYDVDDRLTGMVLGEMVEAQLSYTPQQRLESIEYRTTGDRQLIEGYNYQYDATGKIKYEIESGAGPSSGERYYYDDAHRVIRAQYGVHDVFDPSSALERETSYEHFAEGAWKRRVDVDGRGGTEENLGTVNQRNRYLQFGNTRFAYDANGNCLRKESSNRDGYCLYTYDQDNRLIKAECHDGGGRITQTIEYFYDALGRQVRKVVTDKNGVVTEYAFVWAGSLLIEEYENGVLARTYVYGNSTAPAQLSTHQGRRSDFLYVINGRGLATGMVPKHDPMTFAEKYGYELTGAVFMKEIGGVPVGLPHRHAASSGLKNSILFGSPLGSLIADWENRTVSAWGAHLDPSAAALLNSLGGTTGGKGRRGIKETLADQMRGFLNGIGQRGHGTSVTGRGSHGGTMRPGVSFSRPGWSLFAADGGTGNSGGAGPMSGVIQWIKDTGKDLQKDLDTPIKIGPFETTVASLLAGAAKGMFPGNPATDPNSAYGPRAPGAASPADKAAAAAQMEEAGKKASSSESADVKWKADEATGQAGDPDWQRAQAENKAEKEKNKAKEEEALKWAVNDDENPVACYDPNAGDYNSVVYPTPQQIEAKLNGNKRPIDPSIGVPPQLDPSSPPPHHGGLDPTVAFFNGEGSDLYGSTGTLPVDIAPIDYVRGWEPPTLELPHGPGTAPNTGQYMPGD